MIMVPFVCDPRFARSWNTFPTHFSMFYFNSSFQSMIYSHSLHTPEISSNSVLLSMQIWNND